MIEFENFRNPVECMQQDQGGINILIIIYRDWDKQCKEFDAFLSQPFDGGRMFVAVTILILFLSNLCKQPLHCYFLEIGV